MKFGLNSDVPLLDNKLRSIIRHLAVDYVSLIDLFCDATGCLTFAPGSDDLTSWDTGHITTPAAIFAAQYIRDAGLIR
jgi:hypothetical protein